MSVSPGSLDAARLRQQLGDRVVDFLHAYNNSAAPLDAAMRRDISRLHVAEATVAYSSVKMTDGDRGELMRDFNLHKGREPKLDALFEQKVLQHKTAEEMIQKANIKRSF